MTHPGCTEMLAQAHTAELELRATEARAGHELRDAIALAKATAEPLAVTIRFAGVCDIAALGELAQLDSALPLTLPALLAEVEGELRAALSLHDGQLIANPFHPTLALAELLRTRARQIGGDTRDGGLLTALRHPLRTMRAIRGAVAAAA